MSNDTQSADAIDESFVPSVRRDVEGMEIEGELLLFDQSRGAWHLLNPTATVVWTIADGTGSVDDLAGDIADVLEVDVETARSDVLTIVRDFGRRGLLEDNQPGGTHSQDHDHVERASHDHAHHTEPSGTGTAAATTPQAIGAPRPQFLAVPPSS